MTIGKEFARIMAANPRIDQLVSAAESLAPDDRLKLVAKLWASLPREHRVALVTLQLDDSRQPAPRPDSAADLPESTTNSIWPAVRTFLFDPALTSGLYSAPRRFDLATIFVVTAAYSLFFGALTAIGADPSIKITLGSLVTVIGAAQALFLKTANPRGVSVVTGALANTVAAVFLWSIYGEYLPEGVFVVVAIYGFVGGAIIGYLFGAVIGGVFLVADIFRKKLEQRPHAQSEKTHTSGAD